MRSEKEAEAAPFRDSPRPRPNLPDDAPAAATVLDPSLLERLDDELRARGAAIVDSWAPGLTDAEIDALLLPAGIDLPEEARVWWRWHDGTREDARMEARTLAWRAPVDLETVVDMYEHFRGATLEVWGVDGLLEPLVERPRLFFDCTGPRNAPVPIFVQDDVETPAPLLGSIGDLVTAWLELLRVGAWTVDASGVMHLDTDRVPDHLQQVA